MIIDRTLRKQDYFAERGWGHEGKETGLVYF